MPACLPLQVAQLGLTITAEEEAEMDDPANAIGNPTLGALTQALELWQHASPRLVGPDLHVLKTAVKHQVMLPVGRANTVHAWCPTADHPCSGRDLGDCSGMDLSDLGLCSEHLFHEDLLMALPVQTLLGRMAGHRL